MRGSISQVKDKNGTVIMHRDNLRRHIIPKLGAVRLHELQTDQLQGLYSGLLKARAPSTVARIRSVFSAALNQAVVSKKLVANPHIGVKLPKNLKTTRTKEMVVYTEDQVGTLLASVRDDPLYIAVLIGVTTGVRLGEALGLRWNDINWEARTTRVDESSEYSQAEGVRLTSPTFPGVSATRTS